MKSLLLHIMSSVIQITAKSEELVFRKQSCLSMCLQQDLSSETIPSVMHTSVLKCKSEAALFWFVI